MATPRVRATVKAAAAPSSAFDLCRCPQRALLATRRRHGVQVREQLCRRALHARADGLGAADHLLCEGAVCTRVCDRVLRRCHAAPKRCGLWLRARALSSRPKLTPASPIVASWCPCMWVVVWLIAAKLHSHHPGHFNPYPLVPNCNYGYVCSALKRKAVPVLGSADGRPAGENAEAGRLAWDFRDKGTTQWPEK